MVQERGRCGGQIGATAAEDFAFAGGVRVADADPHQEAVQLRFGKWIGAVVLDRVLGRDHHERAGERIAAAVDGDLLLVHGFEQG